MVFFNFLFNFEQKLRHKVADYGMASSCTATELYGNM